MAILFGALTVDSPSLLASELSLWFAFSLYCLAAGIADQAERPLRWRLWWDRPLPADQWYRYLVSWDILRPEDVNSDLPARVSRAMQQVTAYQAIGFGLVGCLAVQQ